MNKEEPYRDQAERLKQRIEKINEKVEDSDHLPPREQVHRQKKQKTKWKLKYPVIRLLVLCFIFLPIIIFSVISYQDGGKKINGTEKSTNESVETINLEKSNMEAEDVNETIQGDPLEISTEEISEEPAVEVVQPDTGNSNPPSGQTSGSNESSTSGMESDKNSKPQTDTSKTQPTSTSTTKPKAITKTIYHTVQPKETLFSLAQKYYHSQNGMDIIKKANHLQSDQIKVGQVLKIPLNN